MTAGIFAHWPNRITALRFLGAAALFVVLALYCDVAPEAVDARSGSFKAAFWLFIATAVSDVLDGYLARRGNHVTAFGRIADPFVDKVLVMGAMVFLAVLPWSRHFFPAWIVSWILAREFLVTASAATSRARRGVPADWFGKVKMFLQCFAVGIVLGLAAFQFSAAAEALGPGRRVVSCSPRCWPRSARASPTCSRRAASWRSATLEARQARSCLVRLPGLLAVRPGHVRDAGRRGDRVGAVRLAALSAVAGRRSGGLLRGGASAGSMGRSLRGQEGSGHLRARRSARLPDHRGLDDGSEPARPGGGVLRVPLLRRVQAAPGAQGRAPAGGDGILLDDVVAGVYGFVLVMLPARLLVDVPWTVVG
jgi:CDP-diacylglycerol--glycerol-3-phosphate 3-phosphatidyltransferase